jgi:hypothetical protein
LEAALPVASQEREFFLLAQTICEANAVADQDRMHDTLATIFIRDDLHKQGPN